ncbi:cupin domain-containing protein (plasmid) [Mycolicibacterium psychrotolerans]|uniref:cupin domain-containing protein n=1 Tax=Mycolicibacterium psychrotolerans TaxID=216929 RepID=UPI003D66E688
MAIDTGFPGYRAQFVSHLEDALFIHSVIQENGCGPGLHYHKSDQLYFLLNGAMNIQLGQHVHTIGPRTLVFIPAGLAHRNWNDGPGAENHFEMIIPTPTPGAPIALMIDSVEDVPAEHRATQEGYVRRVDAEQLNEALPGFRLQSLADPGSGSLHAVVNYAEVDAGSAGPGMHIHPFDQYYLVIDGELTVEVALQKHVVRPDTLVVLPAGVPHRQYNAGSQTERHIVVLAPAPQLGQPWDQGVDLCFNGETHNGPNDLAAKAPLP